MTAAREYPASAGWIADDSTFGARLALVRQRMQWGNVKEAALACGLPPESWRTWERDGVTPRRVVEIAAKIADRTGCDFGWLLEPKRLRGMGKPTQAYPAPAGPDRMGLSGDQVTDEWAQRDRRAVRLREPVAA